MLLLEALAAIVGTIAELPVGILGLDEINGLVLPVWARVLNALEVWVRIALDALLVVHHRLRVWGAKVNLSVGHGSVFLSIVSPSSFSMQALEL